LRMKAGSPPAFVVPGVKCSDGRGRLWLACSRARSWYLS